jgi:hypothetical protein
MTVIRHRGVADDVIRRAQRGDRETRSLQFNSKSSAELPVLDGHDQDLRVREIGPSGEHLLHNDHEIVLQCYF